jgi:hypothetical protein
MLSPFSLRDERLNLAGFTGLVLIAQTVGIRGDMSVAELLRSSYRECNMSPQSETEGETKVR